MSVIQNESDQQQLTEKIASFVKTAYTFMIIIVF